MSMFLDSTFSLLWSFFFWISTIFFVVMMVYYLIVGNATLFWQTLCLSCIVISFEVIAGLVQLITALLMDHHGAKLKYMLFAPLYMLWFWVVNPTTVVVTFIPAIKTIFAGSEGNVEESRTPSV